MIKDKYSPTKFIIGYWTPDGYVISVVDTTTLEQTKPFFTQDPKCATAVIEMKLEELREDKK